MKSSSKAQFPFAVPLLADHFIEWYQDEDTARKVSIAGDYIPPVDEMADIIFSRIQESRTHLLNFMYNPTHAVAVMMEYPDTADQESCHYLQSLIGEVMDKVIDEYLSNELQDWIWVRMQNRRMGAANQFDWQQFCNQLAA